MHYCARDSLLEQHQTHIESSSSPLADRSMQDLRLFQDQFHAPQSLAIFLQPLTPIFFISFSISSNHLFIGFKRPFFFLWLFLNIFFTVPSSGILSTCPNHRHLPFLISQIISGSVHRSINSDRPAPFYFTEQTIFLNIFFLSNIAKVFKSLSQI